MRDENIDAGHNDAGHNDAGDGGGDDGRGDDREPALGLRLNHQRVGLGAIEAASHGRHCERVKS